MHILIISVSETDNIMQPILHSDKTFNIINVHSHFTMWQLIKRVLHCNYGGKRNLNMSNAQMKNDARWLSRYLR